VDQEYLRSRRVFGQIVCSFRYGREEDEVMGMEFQKDLLMASGEIITTQKKDLTKMQVKFYSIKVVTDKVPNVLRCRSVC